MNPDQAQTAEAITSSALLCRDQWPDHFEVLVHKRDMMLADDQTKATAFDQWMAAKAELRRRGYAIWESFDDRRNCYVATCDKRHNSDYPETLSK